MRHSRIALAAFVSLLLASTTATMVMAESSSTDDSNPQGTRLIPAGSLDPAHIMHVAARRIQREKEARWYHHWLHKQHRIARRQAAQRKALASQEAATSSSTQATGSGAGGGSSVPSAGLQAIANCESGGDPTRVSSNGTYRGKYQFTRATWATVGGSGDPAAAPEAEQDRRAAMLMAQAGAGQWPECGR